jgi:general secretion pathway protein D
VLGAVLVCAALVAAVFPPHVVQGATAADGAADADAAVGEPDLAPEDTAAPAEDVAEGLVESDANESVLLNFEEGDIRAVIDSLATALGLSYMIDPRVEGQVTIRTLGRIPKSDLLPVFNRILRNNGIAAVKVGDVYHIVPVGEAKTRAILPPTAASREQLGATDSFVIEIIPCQHVSSEEMVSVLEPFITPGGDVFSYPRGNLLIVTDLSSNVGRLRDLVLALDTDAFRGMKTRTYKIKHGDLDVIYEEIGALLGSYGHAVDGSTGLTIIPMPRLESMTVITFDTSLLDQISRWLQVLDIPPDEGAGRKVRVYRVENAKAADLAAILNELFGGDGGSGGGGFGTGGGLGIRGGAIAEGRQAFGRPGLTAAGARGAGGVGAAGRLSTAQQTGMRAPMTAQQQTFGAGTGTGTGLGTRGRQQQRLGGGQAGARGLGGRGAAAGQGQGGVAGGSVGVVLPGGRQARAAAGGIGGIPAPPPIFKEEVRIVADEVTNALVIFATKQDYEMILSVLKDIDVVPRQVLIEVMIAEVTLDRGMEFGVDHAIRYGGSTGTKGASAVRNFGAGSGGDDDDDGGGDDDDDDDDTSGAISAAARAIAPGIAGRIASLANPSPGGLTAIITNRDDFAVVLRALASKSAVKILSAPHILAADNREAHIQVGQSIPILTGTQTNLASTSDNVFNQIQYRDTGTILTILPQVNSEGLVNMQISQEVSAVGSTNFGSTGSPSFLTREAETTMVVQDGDGILIGGIIDEQRTTSRSGVPFIMDIPVLGRLFRFDRATQVRTELLILITPHVIRSRDEGLQVTERYKRGFTALETFMDWVHRDGRYETLPEDLPAGLEQEPR